MVSTWVVTYLQMGYIGVLTHLLTSWYIQAAANATAPPTLLNAGHDHLAVHILSLCKGKGDGMKI